MIMKNKLPIDYHVHTAFSHDSHEPMGEMAQAAVLLGLSELAFTDHFDYLGEGVPYAIDAVAYQKELAKVRSQFPEITLLFGAEFGIGSYISQIQRAHAAAFPFEFIIGSVHDMRGVELYYNIELFDRGKKNVYGLYFEELEAAAKVCDYDVLGHLDYIARYGNYEDNSLHYEDFRDIIDQILRGVIERGQGIELNTSGIDYGLGSLNPQRAILSRYRELGGEIITIGSDAHKKSQLHRHFELALDYLKDSGFDYYTVFRERKPLMRKIKP